MALSELTTERLAALLPTGTFAAAMDYLIDGRVAARVRRGDRIYAHVRGYSDTYRAAFGAGEPLTGACECGRAQPCRHAAAVALAWAAERDSFLDLDRLLAQLAGPQAEAALSYVVDRCLGPAGVDSSLALLELSSADGDRDPLNLEAFFGAVRRLALSTAPARAAVVRELRVRAGRLATRQGRTAGVRALAALLAEATRAGGDLVFAADRALIDELRAAAADLAALLKPGGLAGAALRPAWLDLGAAVTAAPPGLLPDLLHAGALLGATAAEYFIQRTRAALALACAEAAAAGPAAACAKGESDDGALSAALASERARGLAAALVEFLLAQGRDDDAVAFARAEARGPVGPQPLIAALVGAGRWDEAIGQAQAALAAADSAAVRTWRRTLADLYRLAGRPAEALPYLAANYEERPDAELYRELRELAGACGVWPELRAEAISRLRAAAPRQSSPAGRRAEP